MLPFKFVKSYTKCAGGKKKKKKKMHHDCLRKHVSFLCKLGLLDSILLISDIPPMCSRGQRFQMEIEANAVFFSRD